MKTTHGLGWALLGCLLAGCTGATGDGPEGWVSEEDEFSSAIATLLDFELDGEVVAGSSVNPKSQVRAQLIYTVGHFNQENGVSRLNAVEISNVQTTWIGAGRYRIRYHAKLPVAWASKHDLPTSYTLTLPKRVDAGGLSAFMSKYGESCTEHTGHALTKGNVWYYYRPGTASCSFDPVDVTTSVATVVPSALNSVAKYPEYHRIWEDGVLDVVAVFGKNQRGATSNGDAGIAAYNQFVASVRSMFPAAATTPSSLVADPGVLAPDITFDVDADEGRVSIVALLVDEVASAPASFNARFAEATPRADLILYGGHAGLGANVRALTTKARFFPAKYQLLFLNGCDTFAYEDDALVNVRKALNPSDPTGSKYLDVMRNAMPAYFHSLASDAIAVIDAALDPGTPRTYEQIFWAIDPDQVVLVTGEEDNAHTASFDPGPRWEGMSESGGVAYRQSFDYATDVLPAGKYVFELTPAPSYPGGDADLFLRVGSAPLATASYKCPSYRNNSNERCLVTLTAPAKVHLKTVGDDAWGVSPYELRAWQRFE